MKNLFKFFAYALIAILVFNSCEDNYTEEDAMQAQQVVNLVISVTDESNFDQPVDSATVSAVINGTKVEKTTDASGIVTFEEVKIGNNLNVYVSKANYTKTFTSVNTTPSNYRQSTVSANISIYSLADASTATVKGQLTIETDLTNRTKEVLSGMEVRAFNYNLPNGSVNAFIGITDSVGKYEIKVPVNANGNDAISVEFAPTVEASRTAGVSHNNIYSVETKNAIYQPNYYNSTYIPGIPSAVINIEAPVTDGSGFEMSTEVDTSNSTLSTSSSNWTVIKKGSGYFPNITGADTTLYVFFSPDTKGLDTARIELTFEKNGGLTNIGGIINYGTWNGRTAKYSAKPTIDLNIGGGTGAEIYFDFKLFYYVKISNNGSGYINFPDVKKTYNTNGVQYTVDYDLSSDARIVDGSIYYDSGNDYLTWVGRYDSAPTYTIVPNANKQAVAYIPTWGINNDSTLQDNEQWNSAGENYDAANPPAITITTLAGYGSGAVFYAEVSSSGSLNNLELVNAGSGYVSNINDFENDGSSGQSGDDGYINEDYFGNVLPGDILISNAYYGTGEVIEE